MKGWDSANITNRLGIRYDDDLECWKVSGPDQHASAMGSGDEMVRMARAILENIPDGNGPALDAERERGEMPTPAFAVLNQALGAALDGRSRMTPDVKLRLGAGLMAAGLHLIRNARDQTAPGTSAGASPAEIPFALRLEEERNGNTAGGGRTTQTPADREEA